MSYARSAACALKARPSLATFGYSLWYAAPCIRQFLAERPRPLAVAEPWVCYPAVRQVERLATAGTKVFEFGSGGSTLYLAGRVAELHSVEHDPQWHALVRDALRESRAIPADYRLREPETKAAMNGLGVSDPHGYLSADARYSGKSFEAYARTIDEFEDGYFDLVIVDGRARPSCLFHAKDKVCKGGVLMLDQSERPYYLQDLPEFLNSRLWRADRFMAPLPGSLHFTEATFFTKLHP